MFLPIEQLKIKFFFVFGCENLKHTELTNIVKLNFNPQNEK
jgi:hypothetical protein